MSDKIIPTQIFIDWEAILATPGQFRITLRSYPNPDFGETEARKAAEKVTGTLHDVVKAAHAYRAGLGMGNWGEPVIQQQVGKRWVAFARISYNGRLWPVTKGGWVPGMRALFEKVVAA